MRTGGRCSLRQRPNAGPVASETLEDLADNLYLEDANALPVIVDLFDDARKRFLRPARTGKTYIALKLAEHLTNKAGGQARSVPPVVFL